MSLVVKDEKNNGKITKANILSLDKERKKERKPFFKVQNPREKGN